MPLPRFPGPALHRVLPACWLLVLVALAAPAQPGALDPAFYRFSVFDDVVFAVATQPDGRVLVGGTFNTVTGVPRNGIARVHAHGGLDWGFNPGIGVEGGGAGVYALALYTNGTHAGKVMIAGSFTQFNRVARAGIARLNADGTLDTGFNPGTGIQDGEVWSIALQSDGKVVVGGSFTTVQGFLRSGVARFHPTGALDTSFNPGTGADDVVFGVAVQPDGKIVVAGAFTTFRGVSRPGIARLSGSGTLDPLTSFNPGDGVEDGAVYALALQPDGRILIAGDFTSVQGEPRDGVARLNSDGSLDTDFVPDSGGAEPITVWAVAAAAGDKVIVGGEFTTMAGRPCDGIARLLPDGKQDATFTNTTPDGVWFNVDHGEYVLSLAVQPDGRVVVGGTFELINNFYRPALARLGADGNVDRLFNQESGASFAVGATAVQPDGKLLLGGQFAYLNGSPHTGLGRLQADGLVDDGFQADLNFNSRVNALVALTNGPHAGKVLAGGTFTSINGVAATGLARVQTNGVLDAGFAPVIQPGEVLALAVQADGKVLLGGAFTSVHGVARGGVARLNSDGTLDEGFNPGSGAGGGAVSALTLQTNGQVVIGGAFASVNGTARQGLARLNTNGAVDLSFDTGSGVTNGAVLAAVVQPDGKVVVAGSFTAARGVSRRGIARFNADGTLDGAFNPGEGISDGEIRALTLQTNGQLLIGGSFTNYNRIPAAGIARLNADGSFDYGFDPGSGLAYFGQVRARVNSLTLQPDGRVLVGGAFVSVNGVGGGINGNVERLLGGAALPTPPSLLYWPAGLTVESGETVEISVLAAGSKPLAYQWRFNASALPGETNALLRLPAVTTNQAGAYSVIVTNAHGAVTSPPIALTVIATVNLAEALNAPELAWTTGGNRRWYGQTSVSHDGVAAAQSGPIQDNQTSTLSTTVLGPGRLSFWWKVSSEDSYDWLEFHLNGGWRGGITGDTDWAQRTYSLPAGPVTLTWTYSKDISFAAGLDAGWVDQVSFLPAPRLTAAALADGRFQLTAQAAPNQVIQVQASTTLTNWVTLATLTNVTPPLVFVDHAATNFERRFYRTLTP